MTTDFRAALDTFLLSTPAITALVGDRIYPMIASPESPLPYVTCQLINFFGTKHLTGNSGLARENYQITLWGQTPAEAHRLKLVFIEALDGYRGVMGPVAVSIALVENALDGFDEPTQGRTLGEYSQILSVDFWYHRDT